MKNKTIENYYTMHKCKSNVVGGGKTFPPVVYLGQVNQLGPGLKSKIELKHTSQDKLSCRLLRAPYFIGAPLCNSLDV